MGFYSLFGNEYQSLYIYAKKKSFLPYIYFIPQKEQDIFNHLKVRINHLNSYYYDEIYKINLFDKNKSLSTFIEIVHPTEFELKKALDYSTQQLDEKILDTIDKYDKIIQKIVDANPTDPLSDFIALSNFEILTKNHYKILYYILYDESPQKTISDFLIETFTDQVAFNYHFKPYLKEINQILIQQFQEKVKMIENNPLIRKENKFQIKTFINCSKQLPPKSLSYISLFYYNGFFKDYGIKIQKSGEKDAIYSKFYKIWFNNQYIKKRIDFLNDNCKKILQSFH
jgi:hypothetical protein